MNADVCVQFTMTHVRFHRVKEVVICISNGTTGITEKYLLGF